MVSLRDNKHVPPYAYKQKKQHITYCILEANSNFKSIWNVGQNQKQTIEGLFLKAKRREE
jgi:hypothetical protein